MLYGIYEQKAHVSDLQDIQPLQQWLRGEADVEVLKDWLSQFPTLHLET